MTDEVRNKIKELKNNQLLNDYLDLTWLETDGCKDIDSIDILYEYLQDRVYEQEIIYYDNAIKFLEEHDASLHKSLEIASELCYSLDGVNSETLATLLLHDMLLEQLYEEF
jgi:hypothetical protein